MAGHRAGARVVRRIVETCARQNIECLTLFAFSSENWLRPADEVSLLMRLFSRTLREEEARLREHGVRLTVIGDRTGLPTALQDDIARVEACTAAGDGLHLMVAANYGGRWDIAQAARSVTEKALAGELQLTDITADLIGQHLSLCDLPEPDLFIRTGGEQRVSNFLLWQLAYSELFFTETLWPDFSVTSLDEAINSFSKRQRRFGRTGDQVRNQAEAS